jgi:hypothetical protein
MAAPKFEIVPEDEPTREEHSAAASILLLSLKTLSQRAIAALASLFFLATVASCWYLWYLTPDPSVLQITSLSIYAAFVLAANWLVRRK